jgi:hypothetical protein
MRIDIPGTADWIELKDIADLTWADEEAFDAVLGAAVIAARYGEVDAEDEPDDGMEISADGVSMVPKVKKRATITLTLPMLRERRDVLLAAVITGWSYDVPLPYNSASQVLLPRAAGKALVAAIEPYIDELGAAGPKGKTAPSGGSASA